MTDRLAVALAALRSRPDYKPQLLDSNFPKQCEFIKDTSRKKALFCTRRAAKSYTGGLYLVQEALEHDNVNCLYLGLTRLSAKGIIWKDILKDIDKKNRLDMQFNGTELTATLKNGSIIHVTGADADADEMEKLLGKKYRLVVIDEAASFTIDLRRLVYGILGPAMIDQGGTICLMGTSGDLTQGLFFDVTTNAEPGWKLFQWSAFDNPHIAAQWKEELEDIKQNRPLFMHTPLFKQWYLNEWVIDTEKLVYRYDNNKNSYNSLPSHRTGEWSYILGVDLGYSPDPSAFVLCAFHENDPTLYLLTTFKKTEMDVTDVANQIKWYEARYPIQKIIIDGSNKQAVEEMQNRHGVALTAAEKTGKADFIQIMNADLIQEKIKLSPECQDLKTEWQSLIWSTDGDRIIVPRKENPNCQNHLSDAALYAWRYCYNFLATPAKQKIDPRNKSQWIEHTRKLMDESIERDIARQTQSEHAEDLWAIQGMEDARDVSAYFVNKRRQ